MTRLLSTMKLDMTVQYRNKLYHITLGLAALIVLGAVFFLEKAQLRSVLPAFFMLGVGGTTYMFVAGMILFEKSENTLSGLIVTPLTTRDYMVSKVVTLVILAALEASITIFIAYGFGFNWLLMYGGLILVAAMMVLIGIITVVRYDSVTDFLVPTIFIGIGTELPVFMLFDFGAFFNALWYVIPTSAPFLLMVGGFNDIPAWQLAYGVGYSLLWIAVLGYWAHRAFEHHIVMMGGN